MSTDPYPGDRELLESLSKYIHPVLQELQFERGTGSLAAHNLRLALIEVEKALRGERRAALKVGVGFPLSSVAPAREAKGELPELPKPAVFRWHWQEGGYTADQMRAYARSALSSAPREASPTSTKKET